jgi:hypothetical protein
MSNNDTGNLLSDYFAIISKFSFKRIFYVYNRRKAMNTALQENSIIILNISVTQRQTGKIWQSGRWQIWCPLVLKLLMKVKSICISAFKERQRETEGERET